ncbi:MAG TPA: alpha/beta fold hydrolase [Patescibacteria group bacterium]|nr:alpha/beta fold hydrolase [Patescibacteria group bacterium]
MKLNLKSDNQNIAAYLIKPEGFKYPLPALIFIHGWKSNSEGNIKRATEISKLGFICLTLDLRGHGESEGSIDQFSREDHLQDIKAAYGYLSKLQEVNPNKIGIIGSSYGGYLSAVASNFLEFEWLILRVPALYFDDNFNVPTDRLINEDPRAFKTSNLKTQNSLALKGVSNFPGDILIIESEKDDIIPHPVIENYSEAIPDKRLLAYIIMNGAGHSLETKEQEKEYIEILKNWLKEKSSKLEVEV